jgi:hypothetical protein
MWQRLLDRVPRVLEEPSALRQTDKESTDWGSSKPQSPPGTPLPRFIRSAFEDRTPSATLRKRRRPGTERPAKQAAGEKAPKRCGVCSGDHPTRKCAVGA